MRYVHVYTNCRLHYHRRGFAYYIDSLIDIDISIFLLSLLGWYIPGPSELPLGHPLLRVLASERPNFLLYFLVWRACVNPEVSAGLSPAVPCSKIHARTPNKKRKKKEENRASRWQVIEGGGVQVGALRGQGCTNRAISVEIYIYLYL